MIDLFSLRMCYYSNDEAKSVQMFCGALNKAFGEGLLTRKEFKGLFENYIFSLTFAAKSKAMQEGARFKFDAASCCGLQPGKILKPFC